MALAKHRTLEGSQACSIHGGGQSIQELNPPPLELFRYKGHSSMMLQEGESSDSLWSYSSNLLPFLSDPTNSASTDYVLGAVNSLPREALSPINYSATTSEHWAYSNTSVLSFDQGEQGDRIPRTGYLNLDHEDDECAAWIDAMDESYQLNHLDIKRRSADSRLIKEEDCFEVESEYGLIRSPVKDKRQGQDRFGLMYPGAATVDGFPESMATVLQKRSYMDACDMQSPKKQYCGNTRKIKEKSSPSKDPQSIAAKNRRERISERLKILQDLVPNGTKVDLVTMLEKAISYVKFLQLQVKVLATDEFWPAQGGKAPDVGQVKEAIDAILSSQRDRNSSSKQ